MGCRTALDVATQKPLLRGKIHLAGVLLSPWWVPPVFQECRHGLADQFALVAVASTVFCFSVSSIFHNFKWSDTAFRFIQKLDHTGIFLMIGGSILPVQLHFRGAFAVLGLLLAGGIICFGVSLTLLGALADDAPDSEHLAYASLTKKDLQVREEERRGAELRRTLRAKVYLGMGLAWVLMVPEIVQVLTFTEILLLFLTGVCYVAGAITYKNQWPNPYPRVYGFHECFHSLCAMAALFTMLLNVSVLRRSHSSEGTTRDDLMGPG
jgi:predicted membrane channel-forming protein YqfA (hemolysin III family)